MCITFIKIVHISNLQINLCCKCRLNALLLFSTVIDAQQRKFGTKALEAKLEHSFPVWIFFFL